MSEEKKGGVDIWVSPSSPQDVEKRFVSSGFKGRSNYIRDTGWQDIRAQQHRAKKKCLEERATPAKS